jgi:hypothetical protein
MKKRSLHKNFIDITAALLILLFAYTGISKLSEQRIFEYVISKSPLIGTWAPGLSWTIPIVELLTVILLFFPYTKLAGLWASLGLMLLFTGYIAYMLVFSSKLPCSCGGVLKKLTWIQHLEFNVLFTLLSGISIRLIYHNKKLLQQTGTAEHLHKKVGDHFSN